MGIHMHLHVRDPHTRRVVTQPLPSISLTLVSCQVLHIMSLIEYMYEDMGMIMTDYKGMHL